MIESKISRYKSQLRSRGQTPHRGTITTIARGGSMVEMSTSTRKRYSQSMLAIQERPTMRLERVLVDQGSSANVLFWPPFEKLDFSESCLEDYPRMWVDFTGEEVQIRGIINLEVILGTESTRKVVKITFTMVNSPTSYNVILGRLALNRLPPSRVSPRFDREDTRPQPDEDLKEIQVGLEPHQWTKIGASLDSGVKEEVVRVLRKNRDAFAWTPIDMPGINLGFLCHCLSISLGAHLVSKKNGDYKRRRKERLGLKQLSCYRQDSFEKSNTLPGYLMW
ncbi:hypothetical protein CR513_56914, partial [Mucuna pruriens]